MKKFNKTTPLEKTLRFNKTVRMIGCVLTLIAIVCSVCMPVFAEESDPIAVVSNLSDFIFGLIRVVGIILMGWGIVQVGLSIQSHDPSQRSQGFWALAGGAVITFAKEILNLITGA